MKFAVSELRSFVRSIFEAAQHRAASTRPGLPPIDGELVGLRDAVKSGWYSEIGEVFAGLPITQDDVVLDVGCGAAGTALWCASRGASMIIADIDRDKVAAAALRLADTPARSVRSIVTDANPLPLEDAAATVVISTEVLEHVDDPAQFLRELFRVGRPGARYLLTVPDPVTEQ